MILRILFLVIIGLSTGLLSVTAQVISAYEVWISDQTNDMIFVYQGDTWELLHEIDVASPSHERGTNKPHMIVFSPDQRYAYVANVGAPAQTNNVVVIDAETYKPVATLPTGDPPMLLCHRRMAAVSGSPTLLNIT